MVNRTWNACANNRKLRKDNVAQFRVTLNLKQGYELII